MVTYLASHYAPNNQVITFAQITASGGSDVLQLFTDDGKVIYKSAIFAVTVANINTNVVVRVEGSLDNLNWFNVDRDEETLTYVSNGTYAIRFDGDGEVRYLRLYVVSESGGTDVTLGTKVKIFEPSESLQR